MLFYPLHFFLSFIELFFIFYTKNKINKKLLNAKKVIFLIKNNKSYLYCQEQKNITFYHTVTKGVLGTHAKVLRMLLTSLSEAKEARKINIRLNIVANVGIDDIRPVANINFIDKNELKKVTSSLFIERIERIAHKAKLSSKRIKEWTFVRLILSAIWSIEDKENFSMAIDLANLLDVS